MNFLFPLLNAAANTSAAQANIGLADGLVVALGGYGVVFAGLISLMVVVTIVGKIFAGKAAAKKAAPKAAEGEEKKPAAKKAPAKKKTEPKAE